MPIESNFPWRKVPRNIISDAEIDFISRRARPELKHAIWTLIYACYSFADDAGYVFIHDMDFFSQRCHVDDKDDIEYLLHMLVKYGKLYECELFESGYERIYQIVAWEEPRPRNYQYVKPSGSQPPKSSAQKTDDWRKKVQEKYRDQIPPDEYIPPADVGDASAALEALNPENIKKHAAKKSDEYQKTMQELGELISEYQKLFADQGIEGAQDFNQFISALRPESPPPGNKNNTHDANAVGLNDKIYKNVVTAVDKSRVDKKEEEEELDADKEKEEKAEKKEFKEGETDKESEFSSEVVVSAPPLKCQNEKSLLFGMIYGFFSRYVDKHDPEKYYDMLAEQFELLSDVDLPSVVVANHFLTIYLQMFNPIKTSGDILSNQKFCASELCCKDVFNQVKNSVRRITQANWPDD